MKKVRDRLYIGNIKDAAEVLTSAHPPVTHMLSLITPNMDPLEFKKPTSDEDSPRILNVANVELDKLVKKIVPIRDIESQNLLDHLEGCLDFIEQGRDNGSILVHCVAGVSRRQVLKLTLSYYFSIVDFTMVFRAYMNISRELLRLLLSSASSSSSSCLACLIILPVQLQWIHLC